MQHFISGPRRTFALLFASFILLVAAAPSPKKGPKIKELDKQITAVQEALGTTGLAVAIVKDGEVVYEKEFGYADAGEGVALGPGHLFNIASCTKAFTAAGLALLVQEGKVKWEDKVRQYVPEFALKEDYVSREMDLLDLLCHRSGLGTFYGDLLWYGTEYTNEEIVSRMKYLPMTEKYGSGFGYQNNMYMIAGLVIERVTGQSWEDFIQVRFFDPLEMGSSRSSNDVLLPSDRIAMPHIDGEVGDVYDFNGTKAAASIYSNVGDLAHWAMMLVNGGEFRGEQVLAPQTVEMLFQPRLLRDVGEEWKAYGTRSRAYALGWNVWEADGRLVVEHDGGMPGYISKVTLVPEMDLGIVVLNNGFDFFVHDVVRHIVLDAYLGHEGPDWLALALRNKNGYAAYMEAMDKARAESRKEGTSPSVDLISFCGTYRDRMYGDAEVRLDEEGLFLTLLPTRKYFYGSLSHWQDDSFKVVFDDAMLPYGIVNFEVVDGDVRGFKIDLPNGDLHFFNLDFRSLE